MKTIAKRILMICFVALFATACDTLSSIAQQGQELLTLAKCNFKFNSLSDVEMLGLKLRKGMTKDDLNVTQLANLAKALLTRSLPMNFNVNLDATNPNSTNAAMSKMDYIIALNQKQVVSSTLDRNINIPANSSNMVSIPITTDLFQLFSNETGDAITNIAFKLLGSSSNPVDLTAKIKPYITVGSQSLSYPDFITINKTLN